ncbi:MAG: hypothetical protein LC659_09660 [Myxococcales bacterium]|nr:hypothetical protein [Myxococcales bacterium]
MHERGAVAAMVLAATAMMTLHQGPARACAVCNCGDPTLTAIGVEQPYRNRVRAGIEERYGSHSQGDGGDGEELELVRSALFAAWTPHPRITVGLVVPWMTTWLTPSTGRASLINGLGDMELSGRVLLARDKTFGAHHLAWATAGLKMPTGPRLYDDGGVPYGDDDQPGSGSWDPFVGATYAWYSGALWSAYGSASYRYTTAGWHGYRRGQQLGWNAALQAQPWTWGGFQLFVDGNWLAQDRLATGAGAPDTGGTVMRLGPAFVFSPRVDLMVRVAASVPVVQAFIGQQHDGAQVAVSLVWDIR